MHLLWSVSEAPTLQQVIGACRLRWLIHTQIQNVLNSPSVFFIFCFAKGQLEGYSDYGSAVFKAGCYLMDLHQSVTADPGKAEPPAGW